MEETVNKRAGKWREKEKEREQGRKIVRGREGGKNNAVAEVLHPPNAPFFFLPFFFSFLLYPS